MIEALRAEVEENPIDVDALAHIADTPFEHAWKVDAMPRMLAYGEDALTLKYTKKRLGVGRKK